MIPPSYRPKLAQNQTRECRDTGTKPTERFSCVPPGCASSAPDTAGKREFSLPPFSQFTAAIFVPEVKNLLPEVLRRNGRYGVSGCGGPAEGLYHGPPRRR